MYTIDSFEKEVLPSSAVEYPSSYLDWEKTAFRDSSFPVLHLIIRVLFQYKKIKISVDLFHDKYMGSLLLYYLTTELRTPPCKGQWCPLKRGSTIYNLKANNTCCMKKVTKNTITIYGLLNSLRPLDFSILGQPYQNFRVGRVGLKNEYH